MEKEVPYDDIYKILLLGETLSGKTSFLSSYVQNSSPESQHYKYNDFEAKQTILKSGQKINVQVWDISGQETFRDVASVYYSGAVGAFIIFDLTNESSFIASKNWINELRGLSDCKNIFLIGNKLDLCEKYFNSRKVPKGQVQQFADKNNLVYYEISALRVEDVNKVFSVLLERIYNSTGKMKKNYFFNHWSLFFFWFIFSFGFGCLWKN